MESKRVLDSGFHAVDSGFQALDSSLCQWNLDSGFQSLVGLRIPWAAFRIPTLRILDSTSKMFPDSGFHKQRLPRFQNPLHWTSRMTENTWQWLTLSKIHYNYIVSDPIPDYLVKRLQRVQLAAASFDLGRCMQPSMRRKRGASFSK